MLVSLFASLCKLAGPDTILGISAFAIVLTLLAYFTTEAEHYRVIACCKVALFRKEIFWVSILAVCFFLPV